MLHHQRHQLLEGSLLRIPAQLGPRLGRISPQVDHVRRPVEIRTHRYQNLANQLLRTAHADAFLLGALALETKLNPRMAEGQQAEIPHAVLDARRNHEILRLLLLQDQPHALHIILRIAPVTQARQVTQIQPLLLALGDARRGQGDLPGHKRLPAALALMVEQDAGAAIHAVRLPVFLNDPETIEFRHRIGAIRVERCILVLRNFLHLAIQLGSGGLVDPAGPRQTALPHGLEDPQHARRIDVRRIFRRVKTHLDMALRRQVVDLVRTDFPNDLDQAHRVAHIGIMQVEMRLSLQVGDPLAEIHRAAADDSVHVITLLQQEFRQVRAILARYTGNQCSLHCMGSFFCQVDTEGRLDLEQAPGADSDFSGQPTRHDGLVLSQPLGQLPLRNALPGQCSLDFIDNFVIYHGNKVTQFSQT